MCATCSRCPGNVRETGREEEKGHLNYSFLKRAWLLLGVLCACERAPREREKKRKKKESNSSDVDVPRILSCSSLLVESLVAGFKKRNVTLSLVPSTVHNCFCCVCLLLSRFPRRTHTYTQTAPKKNLIGRSFVGAQCT